MALAHGRLPSQNEAFSSSIFGLVFFLPKIIDESFAKCAISVDSSRPSERLVSHLFSTCLSKVGMFLHHCHDAMQIFPASFFFWNIYVASQDGGNGRKHVVRTEPTKCGEWATAQENKKKKKKPRKRQIFAARLFRPWNCLHSRKDMTRSTDKRRTRQPEIFCEQQKEKCEIILVFPTGTLEKFLNNFPFSCDPNSEVAGNLRRNKWPQCFSPCPLL